MQNLIKNPFEDPRPSPRSERRASVSAELLRDAAIGTPGSGRLTPIRRSTHLSGSVPTQSLETLPSRLGAGIAKKDVDVPDIIEEEDLTELEKQIEASFATSPKPKRSNKKNETFQKDKTGNGNNFSAQTGNGDGSSLQDSPMSPQQKPRAQFEVRSPAGKISTTDSINLADRKLSLIEEVSFERETSFEVGTESNQSVVVVLPEKCPAFTEKIVVDSNTKVVPSLHLTSTSFVEKSLDLATCATPPVFTEKKTYPNEIAVLDSHNNFPLKFASALQDQMDRAIHTGTNLTPVLDEIVLDSASNSPARIMSSFQDDLSTNVTSPVFTWEKTDRDGIVLLESDNNSPSKMESSLQDESNNSKHSISLVNESNDFATSSTPAVFTGEKTDPDEIVLDGATNSPGKMESSPLRDQLDRKTHSPTISFGEKSNDVATGSTPDDFTSRATSSNELVYLDSASTSSMIMSSSREDLDNATHLPIQIVEDFLVVNSPNGRLNENDDYVDVKTTSSVTSVPKNESDDCVTAETLAIDQESSTSAEKSYPISLILLDVDGENTVPVSLSGSEWEFATEIPQVENAPKVALSLNNYSMQDIDKTAFNSSKNVIEFPVALSRKADGKFVEKIDFDKEELSETTSTAEIAANSEPMLESEISPSSRRLPSRAIQEKMKIFDSTDVIDSSLVTWNHSKHDVNENVGKMVAMHDKANLPKMQCDKINSENHCDQISVIETIIKGKQWDLNATISFEMVENNGFFQTLDNQCDKISAKTISTEQMELDSSTQPNFAPTIFPLKQGDTTSISKPVFVSKFETCIYPDAINEIEASNKKMCNRKKKVSSKPVVEDQCDTIPHYTEDKAVSTKDNEEKIVPDSRVENQKQCDQISPLKRASKRKMDCHETSDHDASPKQCVLHESSVSSKAAGVLQSEQCVPIDYVEEMEQGLNDEPEQCVKIQFSIDSGHSESKQSAVDFSESEDAKQSEVKNDFGEEISQITTKENIVSLVEPIHQKAYPEQCNVPLVHVNEGTPQQDGLSTVGHAKDCEGKTSRPGASTTSRSRGSNQIPDPLRRVSGRFWKSTRDRFSSNIQSRRAKQNYLLQKHLKEIGKTCKAKEQALRAEVELEKAELRSRQEANRKKKEENAKKSEIVQQIKNPAKMKTMKKKTICHLEKRDTNVVQSRNKNISSINL